MMKLLSILFFSLLSWMGDFSQAQKDASTQKKLILLNFSGSDWCGPCIKLKHDVFESEAFGQYAQDKLVLVRADFPRLKKNQLPADQQARNDQMAERYNPNGKFPLTVLVNSQGKVLKEWEGYQPSVQKFITEISAFQ
ncbi:thioredoxin family protein [Aquirufa echingensis]|jgi:thioredoxin-related protein|uniref:Thioredoxin family protein n=1 Tax=Aquirufa echingensis TaxID=3096516 RepID=A0ABW6CX69_9BACT